MKIKNTVQRLIGNCTYYFRSSIKRKFSWVFLLISSLMLILYMGISIYWYRVNMMSSSIHSLFQEMTLAKNNIDNTLSYAEDLSVMLITDSEIQKELQRVSVSSSDTLRTSNYVTDIVGKFNMINCVLIYDLNGNIYDSGVVIMEHDYPEQVHGSLGWHFFAPAPYYAPITYAQQRPSVLTLTRIINSYETGRLIGYLSLYIEESTIRSIYSSHISSIQETKLVSSDAFKELSENHPIYKLSVDLTGEITEDSSSLQSGYISSGSNIILFDYYEPLQCYLIGTLDRSIIDNAIRKMVLTMSSAGIFLILVCLLISRSVAGHLTQNVFHLLKGIHEVQNGNWEYHFDSTSPDEMAILADGINEMVSTVRKTTNDLVEEQRHKRRYQLELLDQQINPHFLYNTLDNICSLAELDQPENVVALTTNLANFYRGALSKGSFHVRLAEECKTAASYLNIMQTRYYQTFSYEFDIPEQFQNNTILRLTLQPILENAIIHGFEDHAPGGVIRIRSYCSEQDLIVEITDNGKGMSPEQVAHVFDTEASTGTGGYALKNVQSRLQLYYGLEYGLSVTSRQGEGSTIAICLPRTDL